VHTLAVHLAPILAAEKSKVPYYIAGGALVAWALIVSVLLGLRKPDFPGSLGGERAVIATTVVLVLGAMSTAIITSGGAATAGAESSSTSTTQTGSPGGASAPAPAGESSNAAPSTPAVSTPTASAPTASTPAPSAAKKSPKATTGTPAPPSSPAATATTTLKLAANPTGLLSYDTKQLSAKAGNVTIDFSNSSPVEHDVAISQGSGRLVGQTPVFTGGSKTLTVKLKPGTYKFYCTVPGHRQAGMEGNLTVS
jgi:plastocyanin